MTEKALYAVNFFMRKIFFNELISQSLAWIHQGHIVTSWRKLCAGLEFDLTLRAGLELELDRA